MKKLRHDLFTEISCPSCPGSIRELLAAKIGPARKFSVFSSALAMIAAHSLPSGPYSIHQSAMEMIRMTPIASARLGGL